MILQRTALSEFVHYLVDGEQIVRNPRVHALIEAKLSAVPPQYRKILATPVFSGSGSSEIITWTTTVFHSTPQPLSSLSGEQYEYYKSILTNALGEYQSAMASAPAKTKELIETALTCHSEDSIYCADDNVVIAEWGMRPKGNLRENVIVGMTFSPSSGNRYISDLISDNNKDRIELQDENNNQKVQDSNPDPNNLINEENKKEHSDTPDAPVGSTVQTQSSKNDSSGGDKKPPQDTFGGTSKKKNRKWLWLLLILLLLVLLGFFLFNSCKSPMAGISNVTSPIDTTKIGISDDSLTYEVKNRVILLIVGGGGVSDFVKAFREQYPDEKKYILENPDTVIPRIVLTLPEDEKKTFIESIPAKFPQFELQVIPETMFRSLFMPNDPAMSDPDKRWYFDMCGVYDAWDETMGDEDIVVAVIDGGFDLSHPEISDKIVKPYNAVEHSSNINVMDDHGTHVAATAVGEANNQKGTAGIAPKCKLMPIQVGDKNGMISTSAVLDGVLYAIAQGADVVNMSLGMGFGPLVQFLPVSAQKNIIANNFLDEQRVWDRIFDMAEEKNVTFVLAGGNENILIGLDPMNRSPKTIKVSAVIPDKHKWEKSNYGDYSTLSAPGVQIYNAVPQNGYKFFQGTSMASPIVAGGVALLKSKNKNYTTKQIIDILQSTGLAPLSDVGPIVNFANALQGKRTGGIDTTCEDVAARYQELLKELDELRRNHPDCIQDPDTLSIPVGAKLDDLYGLWMSTTRLYNMQDEEVVIYFEFNGTSKGNIYLEEPDKTRYSATTTLSINNDIIYIEQDAPAVNGTNVSYSPYSFVCVPDKMRHADGKGVNKINAANKINFKLVKIK